MENLTNKRKINHNAFSITKECIYYDLNLRFNVTPNFTNSQINDIRWFVINKPFSVVQADKNIGLAIITNDLMDLLSNSHLSDIIVYTKLNLNPLYNVQNLVNSC